MSPDPVTYGEILEVASRQLTQAAIALAADPPTDRGASFASIAAYREVVYALRVHVASLVGPKARIDTVRESPNASLADWAGVELYTALQKAVRDRPPPALTISGARPVGEFSVAGRWIAATRTLGAGTDLLATHRERSGRWRTPDAAALDSAGARAASVRQVGKLVALIGEAEPLLWRLARHAGMRHVEVRRRLPQMAAVRDAVHALLDTHPSGTAVPALAALTVARPAARVGDPLLELRDHFTVVRRVTWQMAGDRDAAMSSLADIARLAVHIDNALQHLTRGASPQPVSASTSSRWGAVWLELRQLRTLAPPDQYLRGHARAAEALVRRLAGIEPPMRSTGIAGPMRVVIRSAPSVDVGSVLAGCQHQLTEIGGWNRTTLALVGGAGRVYVPAQSLTGDHVSSRPDLAAAKLARRHVVAEPEHLRAALDAYSVVAHAAPDTWMAGRSAYLGSEAASTVR